MITVVDTPSTLRLVQVIPTLRSVLEGEDTDEGFDVTQWQQTSDYFCEFQDPGECDSGTVCW